MCLPLISAQVRPQGLMEPITFSNLVRQAKECGIPWISSLCGNGEPTLHPKFPSYVRQLAAATKFLELTTNWQRVDEEIIYSVLQASVNLMHVSVDGGNKEEYESMRIGGKLERLLQNLTLLKQPKKKTRSSTLINIRVMLIPSQHGDEQRLLNFWRSYGDAVSKHISLISNRVLMDITLLFTNGSTLYPSFQDTGWELEWECSSFHLLTKADR